MSKVTISFLGATETVTGSRFLVTTSQAKVLVDAGLFQGDRDERQLNWKPFPQDPSSIDALVLTHAHLDHCGYIPLLVKNGFAGKIYSTENTHKLADVILRDSGRIQEEDAKFASKRGYSSHDPALPLYTEADAINALTRFQVVNFEDVVDVANGISVVLHPAGHILGAAFIEMKADDKRILFSGDLGRPEHPVLVGPSSIPAQDYDALLTESTYGDRTHETPTEIFAQTISETISGGGHVLIPAFAVDRTEVILFELRELLEAGKIPNVDIYVDSPMALTSLDFYRQAITEGDTEIQSDIVNSWRGRDPFDPGTLHEMRTVDQSKSLNDLHKPSIIVSASGMATGGRVVHHLARMLPNPKNTVIMVGYQAHGTRGRLLVDGASEVKIHGEMVPVRAGIVNIQSFSVHADADEIISWLKGAGSPKQVLTVHGETAAAEELVSRLKNDLAWNARVPKPGEVVEI